MLVVVNKDVQFHRLQPCFQGWRLQWCWYDTAGQCLIPEVDVGATKPEVITSYIAGQLRRNSKDCFQYKITSGDSVITIKRFDLENMATVDGIFTFVYLQCEI